MSFFPPTRPYPGDRYEGAGEASASWRSADSPPDLQGGGGSCHYLLTGDRSNGDLGLYQWNMGPRMGGPNPHIHKAISESFDILDGVITLHDGERWRPAGQGDFVYVPPREAYFEGLRHIADTGEFPSDEDMAEYFRVHDTYWVSG